MSEEIQLLESANQKLTWLIVIGVLLLASIWASGLANIYVRRSPGYGTRINRIAGRLEARGENEELVNWCEKHLLNRGHDPKLRFYLARALFRLGRYEESKAELRQALALEPTWTKEIDDYLAAIHEKTNDVA